MTETHTQRNRETGTQLETKTGIQKDRNRERACPENVQGVRGTAPAKALGQEASCVTVMRLPAWVTGRFAVSPDNRRDESWPQPAFRAHLRWKEPNSGEAGSSLGPLWGRVGTSGCRGGIRRP